MLPAERMTKIISLLNGSGSVRVDTLAKKFGVSEMTIRRDLEKCKKLGRIHRCYGGAIFRSEVINELNYDDKLLAHQSEKEKIAEYCAALVKEGSSVYLDAGTTNLAIAEAISGIPNLTVITNDLKIALLLSHCPVELIVIGGTVQTSTFSMLGPLTVSQLERMHVSVAFVGVSSINEEFEVSTPTFEKVFLKRAINNSASEVYLVTDFSKFHKQALHKINSLSDFTAVITTEAEFSEEDKKLMAKKHINMVVV